MKRKNIIIFAVLCFFVFIGVLSTLLNTGFIKFRIPSNESDRRIHTDRDLTDRELFLSERLSDVITEMEKVNNCEVAVMLDEPIHIIVYMTLESNERLSDYLDMDRQAVYALVCSTMYNENVTISDENITIGFGELELQ